MILKKIMHAAIGFALTGCTINQYGPNITLGDELNPTTVDVRVEKGGASVPPLLDSKPVVGHQTTSGKKTQHQPSKRAVSNCVPMPSIPSPQKMDLKVLSDNRNKPEVLRELFEADHAGLFKQSEKIKENLEAWYRLPNRC